MLEELYFFKLALPFMSLIHEIDNNSIGKVVWMEKKNVPNDLSVLNENEQKLYNEITHDNRKLEFLGVRFLLHKIAPNNQLNYSKTGKPLLSNGQEISISHSKKHIAMAITKSNLLCGIDVQEKTEKIIRLREKFLNIKELDFIPKKDQLKNTLAWSSKEALFKMIDEVNMPFSTSFNILNFGKNKILTEVTHPKFEGEFELNYKVFDTFVMVYYTG